MTKAPTYVFSETEFRNWLEKAELGDRVAYHKGVEGGFLMKAFAARLAQQGKLFLFQTKENLRSPDFIYCGIRMSEAAGKVFKMEPNQ